MKKLGLALIFGVAIATTATAVVWNAAQKTPQSATVASKSQQMQQISLSTPKKFDLSDLPRALELPLVKTPLQPGDLAPDFDLPDQLGKHHRLSQLRGQTVVLSFYPRDLTLSCVGEAISFNQSLPEFQMRGAKVFSVSVQNVASKAVFAKSYDISYPLLADTNKTTARDYRVLSKDGVAGRVTFVIGPDGHILWTNQKVNVPTHAHDVVNFLDSRKSAPLIAGQPTLQRYATNALPSAYAH
ncbi:peroxiredoxin [bacterium]|nr:MAG: peroxiredoxin [bacterium]